MKKKDLLAKFYHSLGKQESEEAKLILENIQQNRKLDLLQKSFCSTIKNLLIFPC
jgi:hypothetical protein